MMRILIAFIILLTAVFLGIQLHYDPGYVLIAINHWTVETTLWFTIFALVFLFILVHLFLQLCHKIALAPSSLNQWHAKRLTQKAQATTRRGLIEYSEGYWQKAKTHLIQALPNTDTPLLNYLTAARAAQKMGDSQLRDHYLREAQQSMPDAKIAVELTQAQLQLANRQWEQALATLRHLQDLAPKHRYVLKLLMNLYNEVRDWNQLIILLPNLKRYDVINESEWDTLQHNTYLQALADLTKANQIEAVTTFYKNLPKVLVNSSQIVAVYVQYLLRHGDFSTAELLLQRALRKEFDTDLIELYGQLPGDPQQLTFAESLLKKQTHSATLYLCLGRLCITQHLWGKAKHYLEQSLELSPRPVAYFELGKLHERLNDVVLATASYKKGLALSTQVL